MAHSNNTGNLIVAPVDIRGDLGNLLGTGSGDLGYNIASGHINPGAKYKPDNRAGVTPISDLNRGAQTNYGLIIPELSESDLFTSGMDYAWRYLRPSGGTNSPYRALDFISYEYPGTKGYCSFAPNIICCWHDNTDQIKFNNINELAAPPEILFYAFSTNSTNNIIYNKAPGTNGGISNNSFTTNSNVLNSCIGIEDLVTSPNSKQLYGSGHRLGLMLKKQSSNNKTFLACGADLLNSNSSNGQSAAMYTIPSNDIKSIPGGTYTAVACMKITSSNTTTYIPLHEKGWGGEDGRKTQFDIISGGVEDYTVESVKVADDFLNDTPSTSCVDDTNDGVYIVISLKKNTTGINHSTTSITFDNWNCLVSKSGSYTYGGTTYSLSGEVTKGLTYVDTNLVTSSKTFSIVDGNTAKLGFFISSMDIWGVDLQSHQIQNASATLTIQLKFGNIDFTMRPNPVQNRVTVTPGQGNY